MADVHLTATHFVLTLSESEIYTFDRAGRLLSAYDGHSHFWRGLSGTAVEKFSDSPQGKRVRRLDLVEADRLVRAAQHRLDALDGRCPEPALCDRIRRYDPVADREAFAGAYSKVAILPPDQYMSLALQLASGCAWNRCTFCHFYRDQKYRVRTPEEFRQHILAVRAFLGDSQLLRRAIFLGDADILGVEQATLIEAMRTAAEIFPGRLFYGFSEAILAARKTPGELSSLRKAGLRRLYIGAESGHDPLLVHFAKRSRRAHLVEAVRTLKQAGLQVGLIFLVGVPETFQTEHVRDTVSLLASLPLGAGDLIYLSRLLPAPSDQEISVRQADTLCRELEYLKTTGVRVAPYDIRQMIY